MNYIRYGQNFFHGNSANWGTDGLFMSGSVEQMIALFGYELAADSLTFVVNSKALVGDGTGYAFLLDSNRKPLQTSDGKFLVVQNNYTDYRNFVPGASLDLYNNPNGTMIGRFYVQDVTQINRKAVRFTCTDGIGILAGMDDHNGGIYTGQTVASILAEIFSGSGLTYTVSDDVAAVQCYGRLPKANRRENLGKLLVATGATLTESNGVLQVVFLGAGSATTMHERNVYMSGGSVANQDRATAVQVTEHAYYELQTDEEVVLFDNTAEVGGVTNQLVVFSEPAHDLTTTGTLAISSSNANYAIVSGVGTLTGQIYTHTQRVIEKSTEVTAAKVKVEAITDNELIGMHNSDYVAQRMANWYKVAIGVGMQALDPTGTLMPGTLVTFVDPFGVSRTGWTKKKTFDIGNKTKAVWDIAVDWQPGPWGSNLDAWELITQSGTWTVPQGVTSVTFVLGSGGQAGYDGANGNTGGNGSNDQYTGTGLGGDGGAEGNGGEPGKVNSVTVAVSPGDVITITIGAGGATNGVFGSATTISVNGTTYTSEDGVVPESGFTNQWNGDVYALSGPDGIPGGKGGNQGSNGENVGEYTGGARGSTAYRTQTYGTATGVGGGGGGAANGGNGENGESGDYYLGQNSNGRYLYGIGGDGGDGANAETEPYTPPLSGGGRGGNGGGGGGGGGDGSAPQGAETTKHSERGYGGSGGNGSPGTAGGDGFCLSLYKQAA